MEKTMVGLGIGASVGSRALVTAGIAVDTGVGDNGGAELVLRPIKTEVRSASVMARYRTDCSFGLDPIYRNGKVRHYGVE